MSRGAVAWLLFAAAVAAACGETGDARGPPGGTSPARASPAESARSAGDVPADSLHAAGRALYAEGEIDSARALFTRELSLARETSDGTAEARALTWLAFSARLLGDYGEARRLGEASLALKLAADSPVDLFSSYNVLGLVAWNEGRLLDARSLFEKAHAVAVAEADTASLAKVWNNRANVLVDLGEFAEARPGFEAAIEAAEARGEALIQGRALTNLGMLDIRMGDPVSAIVHLERARPILRSAEDVVGEQAAIGHLGTAYVALGATGRAIAYLDSALQLARAGGLQQEEASNLEQLAEIYRDAGVHERALELYGQARELNARIGLPDETGADLRGEAQIHAGLGNLELARRKAEEALAIHREIGSRFEQLHDLVVLAELAGRGGGSEAEAAHLAEAERLARDLGARTARMAVALARARAAERAGAPARVLWHLSAARADFEGGGYGAEWEAHSLRARAHAALGDLEAAAREGRRSVEAIERVRTSFGSGMLRTSYQSERASAYTELVGVLLRLGREEEALVVADAARGRALVEQLLLAHAGRAGEDGAMEELVRGEGLLRRIDGLVRRLDTLDLVPAEERTRDVIRQTELMHAEIERTRSEYAAALVRAAERDPAGLALLGVGDLDVRRLRMALLPEEALLEFLVTPERVLAFVARRDGVRHFAVELDAERLAARVRVARELAGRRDAPEAEVAPAVTGLHEVLLGPALAAGALEGVSRLLLIPHADLVYLPFAALRSPATGRYLVEDYVLLHLPSAAALLPLRARAASLAGRSRPPATALAPFPDDLPASGPEVRAVGAALGGAEVRVGARATEAEFRRALAAGGVVHAATHGILNARSPIFSRIELAAGAAELSSADDGRLEMHELLGLRVRSPLVFLSGCETGVGPAGATAFARGEDYATLARAFLYAGAANVVATLWRVDDEGAAAFAGRFYRALRARSPAAALAEAQRAMIADADHRSPYFWAAYRVSGAASPDGSSAGLAAAPGGARGSTGRARPQGLAAVSVTP